MQKFATKVIHSGYVPDKETGAIMPPIYMTSTYLQDAPGENRGYEYTRAHNPNFTILEELLASLEEGKYATVFSSGMGALTGLVSTLRSGDSVIAIETLYGGTFRLFNSIYSKFGINFQTRPPSLEGFEKALQDKPKWLIFETPTNPLLDIQDIAALTAQAKKYGVLTLVDNTFASPYGQNPLLLGADAVWHSTTKYLGGHSDVIGGVIVTNDSKLDDELKFARKSMGLNPSPIDAWLTTRGIKTLAVRMERHQQNALALAQFLEGLPLVKKVYYPGLKTHKGHEIAKKTNAGL